MTTPSTRPHVIPAVANGILRPDQVPVPKPLPDDDPAVREERNRRLVALLESWEQEEAVDEPYPETLERLNLSR